MTDKEMLDAIGGLIDQKLQPIKNDISGMKNDIAEIKENVEVTRVAVNYTGERLDNLITLLEETNVIASRTV